jgi:copper chaperone CopZ
MVPAKTVFRENYRKMKPIVLKSIAATALVIMAAVAIGAGSAAGVDPFAGDTQVPLAKVVFTVEGMSCGGCVATIQSALAGFDGIADVQVDVAGGTAVVLYDSRKIPDVAPLAQAITASGYPATVARTVTADQLAQERTAAAAKAQQAIAAVGGLEIARADFEAEMAHARSRYTAAYGPEVMASPQGRQLMTNVRRQVARRLIEEGIQLQEIERVGYRIAPQALDQAFAGYLAQRGLSREALAEELAQNGMTLDHFVKKFRHRELISRYVEEEVMPPNLSTVEKQKRYADWFANARLVAQVDFYDADIERLVRQPPGGGGCGSSCTGGR